MQTNTEIQIKKIKSTDKYINYIDIEYTIQYHYNIVIIIVIIKIIKFVFVNCTLLHKDYLNNFHHYTANFKNCIHPKSELFLEVC